MYPSLIDKWDLYPDFLDPKFKEIYHNAIEDRLKAKKAGNKVEAQAKKLIINGLTGKMQEPNAFVFDPLKAFQMRINGQMFLLMLIEKLQAIDSFELIQTNTDGICLSIAKSDYDKAIAICKDWEKISRMTLGEEQFEAFYQFAIGDYLAVGVGYSQTKDESLLKKKGLFIDKPNLGKGLRPLVIPKAIINYFTNGTPVSEFITSQSNILDFCTYQKIDKKFTVFFDDEKVQRINRFYYSTNGGKLYKAVLDFNGKPLRKTSVGAGITIYNKFNDDPKKINYSWYIKEAQKIIDAIECNQLSLF